MLDFQQRGCCRRSPVAQVCGHRFSGGDCRPRLNARLILVFRITSAFGEDETIIRLEGRFNAKRVEDLNKAIQMARGNVLLELSGLQSADAEGALALLSFAAKGTSLVGASPYIRQLLNEKSSRGKDDGQ
jgi:hypothetical protein